MVSRWISANGIVVMVFGLCWLPGTLLRAEGEGQGEQLYSDELYTNIYQVPVDFFLDSSDGGREVLQTGTAQKILEHAGVTFGEGAYVRSDLTNPRAPLLIVHNTQDQMELLEAYISRGGRREAQITVIVEHIEVEASWLSHWLLDHRLDSDGTLLRRDVQKLVRAGNARVAGTSAVPIRSGQRAKTESISEYLVAVSGDPPEISNKVKLTGKAEALGTGFAPTSYVQKNLGTTLEVDAVIGADNSTIDLNLAPELVAREGETMWPLDDSPANFRHEKPKLREERITTQVTLIDGHYALMGTVDPLESGLNDVKNTKLLVFVRADIARQPDGH